MDSSAKGPCVPAEIETSEMEGIKEASDHLGKKAVTAATPGKASRED